MFVPAFVRLHIGTQHRINFCLIACPLHLEPGDHIFIHTQGNGGLFDRPHSRGFVPEFFLQFRNRCESIALIRATGSESLAPLIHGSPS
jgi:hypothetical protein